MENASKALIIAGAILISILLISLGVMIFNQASDITNGNQMKEFEITAFNSKFEQYEGTKNGSQVKTLINSVVVPSNVNEENEDRLISVYYDYYGSAQNHQAVKIEEVADAKTKAEATTAGWIVGSLVTVNGKRNRIYGRRG